MAKALSSFAVKLPRLANKAAVFGSTYSDRCKAGTYKHRHTDTDDGTSAYTTPGTNVVSRTQYVLPLQKCGGQLAFGRGWGYGARSQGR